MSSPTTADVLEIGEGFTIWVVGGVDVASSLLAPLPEGATVVGEPTDFLDAALLLVADVDTLADQLDRVLPEVGTTSFVWVCLSSEEIDREAVGLLVGEHGWMVGEPVELDDSWSALRLLQA